MPPWTNRRRHRMRKRKANTMLPSADDDAGGRLLDHLIELRTRLLRAVAGLVLVFVALLPFANRLYGWLALPLLAKLPKGGQLIATEVASPFFAPLKLAFFVALVIAMPWLLYQLWAFVAPGLYRSEKKAFLPFLLATPILFVAGAALAYYFVFPAAWTFFLSFESPDGGGGLPVQLEAKVSEYLSLVMQLIFAFGLAFQLPVLLTLLAKVGIISSAGLKKYRRYAYVGMFVIAAIITPPDVITQIGLAIPLILLYEVSVITAGFVETKPVSD